MHISERRALFQGKDSEVKPLPLGCSRSITEAIVAGMESVRAGDK